MLNITELNGRLLRLLIGESPCTYWSISQSLDKGKMTNEGTEWKLSDTQ